MYLSWIALILSVIVGVARGGEFDATQALGEAAIGVDADTVITTGNSNGNGESNIIRNNDNCKDEHESCSFWASEGECDNNPGYMLSSCSRSCNSCPEILSSNFYGEDQECQGEYYEELLDRVAKMDKYMLEEVSTPDYDKVRDQCKNRNKMCIYWAHIGECEKNPSFMLTNCAPACETCRMIDYDFRCPRDPEEKNIFGPGDLNKMFSRIAEMENATVLSKPGDEKEERLNKMQMNSPWAIIIDDFVTPEECIKLVHLGGDKGYERSTDVGKMKFDGTFEDKVSTTRTSRNAWCTDECYEDELVQGVLKRIEDLTGVPDGNSEYLQLLKYETGQFYRAHHDYIEPDKNRQSGPR